MKLRPMILSSMFAAMVAVATMIIKIPTVGTGGYVNIGDSIVLVAAWMLGNPYGALAAGIGSALADLLSGYPVYVPGTAVIKFIMAFVAAEMIRYGKEMPVPKMVVYFISGVVAEAIMVLGYFFYEAVVLGYGLAAAVSIGSNVVQGSVCLALGIVLIGALGKVVDYKEA